MDLDPTNFLWLVSGSVGPKYLEEQVLNFFGNVGHPRGASYKPFYISFVVPLRGHFSIGILIKTKK